MILLLFACDSELGPPPILEDRYCADVCHADPSWNGDPDFPTCVQACEADPSITQELLNCMAPGGEGRRDWCLAFLPD